MEDNNEPNDEVFIQNQNKTQTKQINQLNDEEQDMHDELKQYKLQLHKYHPIAAINFETPQRFLFIGRTESGKTTAVMEVLDYFQFQFKQIYVISPMHNFEDYKHFKKITFLSVEDLVKDTLTRLYEIKDLTAENKAPILIILDDVFIDEKLVDDAIFNQIFGSWRHRNISIFCVMQHPSVVVSSFIKSNINGVFLFNVSNETAIQQFKNNFISGIVRNQYSKFNHKILTAQGVSKYSLELFSDRVTSVPYGFLFIDLIHGEIYYYDPKDAVGKKKKKLTKG